MYAFDIYPGTTAIMQTSLQQVSTEIGAQNGYLILISETWPNDAATRTGVNNSINGASAIHNMNIDGMFQ
jgi:hypothetical protein